MGFNAATAVEPLDYDFTSCGGGKGTTPEPTDAQVTEFFRAISKVFGEDDGAEDEDRADAAERVARRLVGMSEAEGEQLWGGFLDAVASVTSGQPSRDELEALPFRIRNAYFGWLLGELGPTEGPAATTG